MLCSDIRSSLTITDRQQVQQRKLNPVWICSEAACKRRAVQTHRQPTVPPSKGEEPSVLWLFKQMFSCRCFELLSYKHRWKTRGSAKTSLRPFLGSSDLRPSALIPIITCIKIDPSWFDYCDKEEAIEFVNAGDKVTPHTNPELPGFGNRSRGSCRLFKAHKA